MWTEYAGGFVLLILIGLFLVNIQQIWTWDQKPLAEDTTQDYPVPAGRLSLFDNALYIWIPILCFVAVIIALIARGRESTRRYGY